MAPRKQATAEVEEEQATELDLSVYAEKAPSPLQQHFAEWIPGVTGYEPNSAKSKTAAFEMGVKLALNTHKYFQKSDENRARNAEMAEQRRAALEERDSTRAERDKAKAERDAERERKAQERAAAKEAKEAEKAQKAAEREANKAITNAPTSKKAPAKAVKATKTAPAKPAAKKLPPRPGVKRPAAKKATGSTASF